MRTTNPDHKLYGHTWDCTQAHAGIIVQVERALCYATGTSLKPKQT